MPAIESPSNLIDLIELLYFQQEAHLVATETVAQTLEAQLEQQAQAANEIAQTLEQLSGLLASLMGQSAGTSRRLPVPQQPKPSAAAPSGSLKTAGKGKRNRGKFALSGIDSIVAFVDDRGSATSAEVNEYWASEGRGGKADNALGQLVKAKRLKRTKIKDGRGSRYSVT